jgi:hypothetical protein
VAAADLHRLEQLADDERQHGPQPQRLLDRRVDVGVLARGDLVAQPGPGGRVRRRRSIAHDSEVAVVSWPATSSVISSSRSSRSLIGEPSSCVAETSRERMSSRSALRGSARRARISSISSSSTGSSTRLKNPRRSIRAGPTVDIRTNRLGRVIQSIIPPSMARIRSRRSPGSRPNTARRMISSVSACIRGAMAMGSPLGQPATSRSATSVISAS